MSKSSRKVRKPLDLPLGKSISPKDVDLSHVRLPIDTSIFGLKQVLTLFETATSEVKSYLAYECDLMYECRVCRTIFRSIANFTLHKRKYCRDKYNTPRDPGENCRENDGVNVIQRDISNANKIISETEVPGSKSSPGLNLIIENLLKRQEQKKFVEEVKNQEAVIVSKHEELKKVGDLKSITLENIEGSDVAVFQTMEFGPTSENTESMKSEVMEIHSIFDRNEAVIGSNGKILNMMSKETDNDHLWKNHFVCTECNTSFLTKKTLTHHVRYKHSGSKIVYPCPLCKEHLTTSMCAYRHLLKIHRMTSNQIRRYRSQIHNGTILKKAENNMNRRKSTRESRPRNDEENQWLDNIEGDSDLQMCGGCGKHFDRKAALISHSIMCTKRIALCNSIKESNSKKKVSDIKENGARCSTTKLTGSAKRKSGNVVTYKPKTENYLNNIQNRDSIIESNVEEKEFSNLSLIEEDNDSDMENCREWIRNDIQMYDKDKVMSIIGVGKIASKDKLMTLTTEVTDKNISSVSNRSDSPCKGFETIELSEHINHVQIKDLSNLTQPYEKHISDNPFAAKKVLNNSEHDVTDNSKGVANIPLHPEAASNNSEHEFTAVVADISEVVSNDSEDKETSVTISGSQPDNAEAESNTSDNFDDKIIGAGISPSNSLCKLSSDSETEVSSEISLDNKINSDFKLDLCGDPNFQDVSIKSLIKEIIREDDVDSETKDSPGVEFAENSVPEGNAASSDLDQEKTTNEEVYSVNHCHEKRLNNNHDLEIIENRSEADNKSCSKENKRKRRNSTPQRNVKKCSISHPNEENLNVTENEVFISRISRFADTSNLHCALCQSQFNSLSELLPHMSNHLSWYRFQCSRCTFMSFNKRDCEEHAKKEHKLSSTHIQGIVLPIPTWKSSLISDNSMLPPNNGENRISFGLDSGTVGEVDRFVNVKLEKTKEYSGGNQRNPDNYIDLTIEDNPDDDPNFDEATKTGTEIVQDLSKQAIMEVILGNKNQKETHGNSMCKLSQSRENARPLRNRTKSVKTSQKDFIYEFDSVEDTTIRGHSSNLETEYIAKFEVQD